MIDEDSKNKFLEILQDTPIVSIACRRAGISKATIYRWSADDISFKRKLSKAQKRGRSNVTDLAESQVIKHIQKGNMRAIEFWLTSNTKRYFKPRKPIPAPTQQPAPITEFNVFVNGTKVKSSKDLRGPSG